ncbi:CFC_HP_G0057300.mRNA.1.CDS.1 [Saccharomyces cerevisiae]|nr:CFC_HP_G0057300.mRNA.1.CDS.1 [Saccharomyces cerevisiae]CAI6541401.1 CFC_HP_G0057300.mRNA.1.CDS.1 [Saccharomyces cerevisiae]
MVVSGVLRVPVSVTGSSGVGLHSMVSLTCPSSFQNPNNKEAPNFNIKIVATDGSTVNGACSYENGVYSGSGSDGCTVSVTSGSANFVSTRPFFSLNIATSFASTFLLRSFYGLFFN